MPHKHTSHEILQDPDFLALSRQKDSISLVLTLLTMVVYFGFMLLLAYSPRVLAAPSVGRSTLGIPVGLGVIVFCWVLTGIYVRWANDKYDAMVARMKQKIEG